MQDYVCPTTLKPIESCFNKHIEHACTVNLQEPITLNEANKYDVWKNTMKEELNALERNGTWELTQLPKGVKHVSSKWIYKLKTNFNRTMVKYKARLVAKGYFQVFGLNYIDSFAPASKVITVRILLTLAAKQIWTVH